MSFRRTRAAILLTIVAVLAGCHSASLPHDIKKQYNEMVAIDEQLDDNLQVLLSAAQQHKDNPAMVDAAISSSFAILGDPSEEEIIRAKNITQTELIDIGIESYDLVERRENLRSNLGTDYNILTKTWYSYQRDSAILSWIKRMAIWGGILLVAALFLFKR